MHQETSSSFNGRHAPGRLTLLLDADDTLWENNIYFLQVTESFIGSLEVLGVDRAAAAEALSATERRNIALHGYGSRSFAVSVREAYCALAPDPDPETVKSLEAMAASIYQRDELELRPGVREALALLSARHRLILVTKGDPVEQDRKLTCSGLRQHFEWVEIVAEKNVELYRQLIVRFKLDPECTWMIGNSPRSDINPALAAGLRAILIPHPQTWELELEEIAGDPGRLQVMPSLPDVAHFFELRG